jgi:4-nitrophenyl phosphatase
MIGDQIATDIVAGQSAGLRAFLIASDVPFNTVTGVVPDRIISSLLDLVGAVSEEAVIA